MATLAESFNFPLVVDPVIFSTHGAPLASRESSRCHEGPAHFPRAPFNAESSEAAQLVALTVANLGDMRREAERLENWCECRSGGRRVFAGCAY